MEGKKQLKHLPPGERMASILRHWEEFRNKNIVPAKEFAPELWTEIRDKLKDKSSKASSAEQMTRLERFEECMKNNEPRNLKATRPVGIDETSYTSGKVRLKVLTLSNQSYLKGTGMEITDLVQAELKVRGIEKEVDKDASLIMKRKAIRLNEFLRLHKANTMKEWKESDVREFSPLSKEMAEFVSSGHHDKIVGIINKTASVNIEEFN